MGGGWLKFFRFLAEKEGLPGDGRVVPVVEE